MENNNSLNSTENITKKKTNKNSKKKSYIYNNNKYNSDLMAKKSIYNNNNNLLNNTQNLLNRNFSKYNKQMNINKNLQNSGFLNPNLVNVGNINIFNSINSLIIQLTNIKEKFSDFNKLKEIGLQALTNDNNFNHYLLNNNDNNNINFNFNFNPHINFVQLINNTNDIYDQNNFQIIMKRKADNPSYEKIQKINISTKYLKNNSNINKEMKISENNKIYFDDIISGKEKRTVVRLNPIPPNFSSFDVSKLLDKYLKIESNKNQRIYKALFVPLSKVIGKNIGYCFVMMVKPKYVIDFYNTFNGINFKKKKCKKPCSVVWANLQGDDFLNISSDPLRSPIIFKDIRKD